MRRRRGKESGFALLLVFLMAAIIAITMYKEIERVAFDSQRQKEQLLIERGEQYKVAIRRFIQANQNRWPASMDELESFNNRRFLRHRYKDPMTGKDEWRLIHIQNGVLTDSKNSKPKTDKDKTSTPNGFIQEMAGLGAVGSTGATGQTLAMRRRASDDQAGVMPGGAGGAPGSSNPNAPPGTPPNPGPGQPGYPGVVQQPPIAGNLPPGGQPPGVQPPLPGAPPGAPSPPQTGGGFIVNQPGLGSVSSAGTSTAGTNGQPMYPGQQGQQQYPGAPGMPVNSQTGGVSPYPVAPGSNGTPPAYGQPGLNPNQQNQAIGLINGILTSPRPGGMAGIQGGMTQQTAAGPGTTTTGFGSTPGTPIGTPIGSGGNTIGGGIAGVASNEDADSIMVYAEHTNYSEWEFVFDPTKWHAPPNPNQGTIGTSAASMGSSANNLNTGIAGTGAGTSTFGGGLGGPGGAGPGAPGGAIVQAGTPGGPGQTGGGQMPGGQAGTTGMPGSSGSSAFGGGGLPDIRPGRR
jgi:hypothetical protein